MDTKKRQCFWKLHGLLALWVSLPLFVMFWAGSFALFERELNPWLFPDLKTGKLESNELQRAVENFQAEVPDVHLIFADISEPEVKGVPAVVIDHQDQVTQWWINPNDGGLTEAVSDSYTHFLLELHYFDFIPQGHVISGFIATFFGVIILSGLVYQGRISRKNLKMPKVTSRSSNWHRWLVLFTLPFQIVYALTGALFGIGLLLLGPIVILHYGGDQGALVVEVDPSLGFESEYIEGQWDIATGHTKIQKYWSDNDMQPELIRVHSEPAPEGTAITYFGLKKSPGFIRREFRTYDSLGGLIHQATAKDNGASAAVTVNGDLHFGTYAGFWSKAVHFWLALLVSLAMTAGVAIWLRRQERKPSRSTKILHCFCVSMFSGLPLATAIGFAVAPFSIVVAIPIFWISWGLTLGVSFFVPVVTLNIHLLRWTGWVFILAIVSRCILTVSVTPYFVMPIIFGFILGGVFLGFGKLFLERK